MSNFYRAISGKHYLMLLGILILAGIVFSNTLNNDFILGWDDQDQVVNNPDIKDLSFESVKTIFKTFYVGMYQPITTLSYALNYTVSGMDAKVFHLTNLVIHLINILLVFVLFFNFTKKVDISLIISILFAVHPMNVETVAWISTRSNLLYALFYLASLISYVKFLETKKKGLIILTFLFFILALLSKASALTLPYILILFDMYKSRKFDFKNIIEKAILICISFVFIFIAYQARLEASHIGSLRDAFSLFERMIFIAYSFVFYLIHLLLPINLAATHYYPVISLPDPNATIDTSYYLAAFVFLIVLAFAIYLLRNAYLKKKFVNPMLFGLSFFVLSIFATIHFVPIGLQIVAERYVYIPYLGFFFIIAFYYSSFVNSNNTRKFAPYLHVLFTIIVLSFSYISHSQVTKWKNCETLMTDVIKQNPKIWHAYLVRGDGFYLTKYYQKALDDYAIASSINPMHVSTYVNRASVYAAQKEYQKALDELNTAVRLEIKEPHVQTFFNRGLAQFNLKNYTAAIEDFNRAIEIKSDYSLAYLYRGVSKGILNHMNDAVIDLQQAIQLDPKNPKAYFSLGVAKSKLKDYPKAIELFTESISLKPDYADAYLQRGIALLMQKKTKTYCKDFHQAKKYGNPLADKFIEQYCKD